MDAVYSSLTTRAVSVFQGAQKQGQPIQRVLIALCGPPGSGKSTAADEVAKRINALDVGLAGANTALVVPMDGFHYSREDLDRFSDHSEAHARRGAPWTFDADAVLNLTRELRGSCNKHDRQTIKSPSFDHATKDPVQDGILITPAAHIVILEGNYLLLNEEPWSDISSLVDDTWFVKVNREVAKRRIVKRHLQAGIEATFAAATRRAEYNDLRNGDLVMNTLVPPNVMFYSVDTV